MKSRIALAIGALVVLSWSAQSSLAISPFKKAFDERYVKNSGDEKFQDEFRMASCNTCHVKGEKKDVVNAYGLELAKLIEGNADQRVKDARKNGNDAKAAEEEKILKELEVAFAKVEELKAASGQTYGEIFKAHQLPTADGAKSLRD